MSDESEFVFELRVCQWAERHWPPGERDVEAIVARQLGTKRRRWDTVVVECDPAGLRQRARFGARELDSDLLHVVRNASEEWTWYRDALPYPGYPWRYVRAAVHRAGDRGVVETRKRDGRVQLRRRWAYPDWVRRVVAIENKPDLDASAARELAGQVEHDVALALADEAWIATRATGATVEPALLEDVPVEAGVLTLANGDADVVWHPRTLAVDDPGTRITDRPSGGEGDLSAARFEYVSAEDKREKRLELAERAYGRGWRDYADSMRPDCRYFQLRPRESAVLPYCDAKDCHQTAGECSGSCSSFEPEPPVWRTKGWPIEGGPGTRLKTLLDERCRRQRPGLDES